MKPIRLRRRAVCVVAVSCLVAGLVQVVGALTSAATAGAYPTPSSGSWTVDGRGNGHGHGLSQYGARGAAIAGLNYKQILAFYYPNTSLGTVDSAHQAFSARVDSNGEPTTVVAQSGLRLGGMSGTGALLPTGPQQWRLVPGGAGFTVQKLVSGTWSNYGIAPSFAKFTAPSGIITAVIGGARVSYRGAIVGERVGSGSYTVDLLTVDAYLKGVIPNEMPASWQAEALKAQTIAARSYAWYYVGHPRRSGYYNICATTSCQVFRGYSGENSNTNSIVDQTSGQVLSYSGAVVFAEFSASNGGITSGDGVHPYFVTKADPYDNAASGDPYLSWTRTVPASRVASYYGFSSVSKIVINSRAPSGYTGLWGGLVSSATVYGVSGTSATSTTVSGAGLASAMGLPYSYFNIRPVTPLGHLDQVSQPALHQVKLRGWAMDPLHPGTPTTVQVTVGSVSSTHTANLSRPDVRTYFHTSSAAYGFDVTVSVPGGASKVCVYARMIDTADRTTLGCRTISVPVNSMGNFEAATNNGNGTFRVTGWEFDPDRNGGPGLVQVYVDYHTWYLFPASSSRPDVQRVFGLANAQEGFSGNVTVPLGTHVICAYGINNAGAGRSVQLNCKMVRR